MAAESLMRILLLGAPGVYIEDQPLHIQRRSLRWMLFYLACQKEMVGRSDLILLFWPDEPEDAARRHLRETLSKLRAQLPDPNIILTEQDRVGMDPRRIYSDALEFQQLFTQTARVCAQTPGSIPLTQAVHQQVVRAVRLWRASRFMAGANLPESEALNDWLLSTSQQMETQRQRLLERLVDHDTANGDTESALQWLRLALEGDEANEGLHYRLLQVLYKQNRYSEALNYCTYLQELFRREGYDELPPSLLSLSRKIREDASQPVTHAERPAWPTLADMQVPFVGRQALLKELQFAVRRGGPVILFGETGSGKSRLVRELFFSLKPAPRLLMAPARIMENDLPFQPIIDLLRHDVQAEEWLRMDLTWATPLSLLLPELTIMRPEIRAPQVAPNQENSLIFEALRQLFLFLGKKQRFLLFLDNAQWSDPTSLSALAYLAERGLFGDPGSLVLAARPEEIPEHLENFLNRPRGAFSVQQMNLPLLDAGEVGSLAHYVLGDAFTPDIAPRLERETGGNPLFLLETLRLVLDYSFDPRFGHTFDHLPLAGLIHALLRERLQHLPPYHAQVLSMAAVIGSEFSVDLLESTCMLPAEQVVQALESLAQSNLIKATLQDRLSSGYAFVHEKFREVILLDLSPARKRLLHLRVARALERKHQGQSSEMEGSLAYHYEEAGELSSAFQHWLSTGLYAGRLFSKEEAFTAYQRAEQILQRLGPQASDLSIYQLYRQWGRLAYDFSDPQAVDALYGCLLQYGQNRQNALLAGSAYNGLAQAAELRSLPALGLEYLDKAAPFLRQSGRLFEYIEALNRQGLFRMQMGQFQDAQNTLEKALRTGEQVSDVQGIEARAQTRYWLSILLVLSGWPVLAQEMTRRSIQDAREALNQTVMIRSMSMQSVIQFYLGRYAESLEQASNRLAAAQTMHNPSLVADLHGSAAAACLSLGRLDECWDHAQQALTLSQQQKGSLLTEKAYGLLGQLFLSLGAVDQAEQMYLQGSQAGYDNYQSLRNRIQLALCTTGDTASRLEILEPALAYTRQHGLVTFNLLAQLVKANLLLQAGRVGEAVPMALLVQAEAQQRCLPEIKIRAVLLQSKINLHQGQCKQAEIYARQAVEEARAVSHLLLEIEGRSLRLCIASLDSQECAVTLRDQLQNKLLVLYKHTQTPELQALLREKEKAWTDLDQTEQFVHVSATVGE